jgi:hypothetical protein
MPGAEEAAAAARAAAAASALYGFAKLQGPASPSHMLHVSEVEQLTAVRKFAELGALRPPAKPQPTLSGAAALLAYATMQ